MCLSVEHVGILAVSCFPLNTIKLMISMCSVTVMHSQKKPPPHHHHHPAGLQVSLKMIECADKMFHLQTTKALRFQSALATPIGFHCFN